MLFEKIQEKLVEHSVGIALSSLIWLFLYAGKEIFQLLSPQLQGKLPTKALLSLFLLSLLINCILFAWILVLRNSKNLELKMGLYWDKKLNPHCPVCKSAIGGYAEYYEGFGFKCIKCNQIVLLTAPDGSNPRLPDAIQMLKT